MLEVVIQKVENLECEEDQNDGNRPVHTTYKSNSDHMLQPMGNKCFTYIH